MAGSVIDCVWSNGIKRQWWPWAGHSGGYGSSRLDDGERIENHRLNGRNESRRERDWVNAPERVRQE